jgi:hypothetical protein
MDCSFGWLKTASTLSGFGCPSSLHCAEAIIVSMAVSVNQFLRSMVTIYKKSGYLGHVFQRYTGPYSDLFRAVLSIRIAWACLNDDIENSMFFFFNTVRPSSLPL